jgi:hypothetical protein
MQVYRSVLIIVVVLLSVLGVTVAASFEAPNHAQPVFATNTPRPPDVLAIEPEGRIDQYALRLWTEQAMIDLLLSQLERLRSGEAEQAAAIRYTLFELELRFPGAPRDPGQRERVLQAMLSAPRGSVDLRDVARPHLVRLFNQALPIFPAPLEPVTIDGFRFVPSAANFNTDDVQDLLVEVIYVGPGTEANPYYADVIPLVAGDNAYQLLPLEADFPALPYNGTRSLSLLTIDDINTDGLDEFVVLQNNGTVNWPVRVFGWRNDTFIELVTPGERILTGSPTAVTITNGEIRVQQRRVESARWNCQSRIPVSWVYRSNLYRQDIAYNATYTDLDTVGCRLSNAEPAVFARPTAGAIPFIAGVLATVDPAAQGYINGAMVQAMLYVLDGQRERALEYLDEITPLAMDSVWLQEQIATMRQALADDLGALAVCAALLEASPDGACDIDAVLERILIDNPISRTNDVRAQLAVLGLPVREVVSVTQVGQAPREYVLFDFEGVSWWAFALTTPDFYVPELTTPPPGYTPPPRFVTAPLPVPPLAYAALVVNGDPLTALTILDNERQDAPNRELALETQFFIALSLDIQGDRERAKAAYYQLWNEALGTTWGQLAGYHLEPRGINEG